MRNPESAIQRAYIRWARMYPPAAMVYAIPNGGARGAVTAAILKAEGVLRGVWDTHLPTPVNGSPGLWIEFKAGSNGLTEEQVSFGLHLAEHGYTLAVAYDAALAAEFTLSYLRGQTTSGVIHTLKPPKPQTQKRLALRRSSATVGRA